MRELKFRVWDDKHSSSECKFWYSKELRMSEFFAWIEQHGSDWSKVQQYTGLKDRNGIEVYEGDIITFRPISNKPPFYEVRYDLERGCFLPYYTKGEYFVYIDDDYPEFLYSENIRVIGNIFENPEFFNKD